MTAKTSREVLGLEYDWLACDGLGYVALFSTAGAGYAPDGFLADTDLYDMAAKEILELPACTKAKFAPKVTPGLINTWEMMTERGLFAFDADPNGGPYRLVAVPQEPVRVSMFSSKVANVLGRLIFRNVKFGELSELSKDLILREVTFAP